MSLSTVGKQVKYGLISKKPAAPSAASRSKMTSNAFSMDDSDDDNTSMNDVARVNAQLAKRRAADEAALLAAANEDPSIYDYDGSYDSFKAAEVKTHQLSQAVAASKDAPKSRYVNNLLSTAKMREKEKERVYEKKLLKERTEEDKEFGDKPKFMTTAYKKKLLEDQKWEYEDRLADEVEQRTDVRKSGMEGFYANLLTKNVAMGGDVEHAVSVYTAGSVRQTHLLDLPASSQQKGMLENKDRTSISDRHENNNTDEKTGILNSEASVYKDLHSTAKLNNEKRPLEVDSNSDLRNSKVSRTETTIVPGSSVATSGGGANIVTDVSSNKNSGRGDGTDTTHQIVVDKKVQIMSAKERYLARKRAQEQGGGV